MSIELRLSDVDPPAPDPPRTIYRDVLNLPDPVKLGITIRYFNHDDVTLYFKITGSGTGYTFGTVELDSLASGADAYKNLDQLASRTKPSAGDFTNGEFEETVTLTLKAYTDAGYTEPPKWTFERSVTVHWIKSDDAAFTVDELDNFDDGTVQGWAVADETGNLGGFPTINVVNDFVLSPPWSCKMIGSNASFPIEVRSRLFKQFTTPNKPVVYAIMDVRTLSERALDWNCLVQIQRDGTVLVHLGLFYTPCLAAACDCIPEDKWMRVVVPLPKDTTLDVRIVHSCQAGGVAGAGTYDLWIDDFKIISK